MLLLLLPFGFIVRKGLWSPGWPQTCGSPPVSASQVLVLKKKMHAPFLVFNVGIWNPIHHYYIQITLLTRLSSYPFLFNSVMIKLILISK